MKKKLFATSIVLLIIVAAVIALIGPKTEDTDNGKLNVSATYYPLFEFAKHVAGDKAQVKNLTPTAAEPHDFEPTPKNMADLQKADVLIYNGGSLEPWTDKFVKGYKGHAVKASNNISLREGEEHSHEDGEADMQQDHEPHAAIKDPHFWLDPVMAQQVVNNIRDGLTKADPQNADYYAANAKNYIQQLQNLDKAYSQGLKQCQHDTVVVAHESFSYVAARYGFTVEAIAGLNPEEEPSAARLAEITEHVKEHGLQYIFFESLVSPQLADTIAKETGAQTLVLDPIEGLNDAAQKTGKDYLKIQYENLENLRKALACQ